MTKKWVGNLILAAFVLLLPLVLSSYGIQLASEIYIIAVFVMSLGLLMGYAGLVSLGHAAFFGIGAYTVALVGEHLDNTYLIILLAIVISAAAALISGLLFIRSKGAYFLMITLAFGQMVYAFVFKMKFTGGADGKSISIRPDLGFGEISAGTEFYYLGGIAFIVCYLLLRLFISSPMGKGVKGVMENEDRMTALGYNVRFYKLVVYTLAGGMAGFAGSLYAYFNSFVSPDTVNWMFSGQALVMVIIGGMGTLLGPAVGAGLFVLLQNFISTYTERWPLIMGLIFVVFVLYGRGGIVHLIGLVWKKLFAGAPREVQKPLKAVQNGEGGEHL